MSAQACLDAGASVTVVNQAFLNEHADLFELEGSSVALDLSAMNATTDIAMDFILGYPTLRQADWTLDFPRRRWAAARAA